MKHSVTILALAILLTPAVTRAGDVTHRRGRTPFRLLRPPGLPPATPAAPDTSVKHLPGSTLEFTRAQISDGFGPADWYPGDHPTMPDVVAHGKKPDVRACSLCHYPNGKGRPENAGVAGLPVSYFIQQMNDFRSGDRKSAEPRKANTNVMIAIAKGMTEDEIKAAAEYFGSMKWTPWIKVVETNTVPKTRIAGGMFLTLEGDEKEPLGQRIIETPENAEGTEVLRDPRSGFIAYVPVGQHQEGRGAGDHGRGQDHAVRPLPWSGSEGPRPGARASPAVRPATWCGRCTTCSRAPARAPGPN